MTTSYLSFGSLTKLHNNSLEVTSPIGEMSNKARTYAKDPGVFSIDTTISETVLYNFLSQTDNVDIAMPQAVAEAEIKIGDWLYTQARNGNITGNRPNTLALLKAQFSNNIEITDIGEMVTNNVIWFPSFVQGNHIVNSESQPFIVWFADQYFIEQYPDVRFTVVHPLPIEDMDSLMNLNYHQIDALFQAQTPKVVEDRVRALTKGAAYPYSDRDVMEFQILDLINTPSYNVGSWRYLMWGNGKDSEDILMDQIRKEILANTKYTEAQWEEKIPDLFNPLEWYVLPYFDRIGITNKTTGGSTHSPIGDRETDMDLVDKYLTPNMSADHVIKSTQTVPFLYKSFLCAFVAKMNNRVGMEKVLSVIPGYQLISSEEPEFDQIPGETGNFIIKFQELLAAAEVITPYTLVPAGITRISRFGKVCVARRIGKVKYIIITRWQYVQDGVLKE